jgi:hypothetical protein
MTEGRSGVQSFQVPLNRFSCPQIENMEVGQEFTLKGDSVWQKLSGKGRVLEQRIIPEIQRFRVAQENGENIAWRIVN